MVYPFSSSKFACYVFFSESATFICVNVDILKQEKEILTTSLKQSRLIHKEIHTAVFKEKMCHCKQKYVFPKHPRKTFSVFLKFWRI